MTQLCRKVVHFKIRWNLLEEKVSTFREFLKFIRDRILSCYTGKPVRYGRLSNKSSSPANHSPESEFFDPEVVGTRSDGGYDYESDSNLVNLKISLLGNSQIGKTTFLMKYVGDKQVKQSLQMKSLNLMDKVFFVKGARIVFRIWDVGGDQKSFDQVPLACKDAVAILFMFDLTGRNTLHSVIGWYNEARKWNQTAIPVLIGTKFDEFSKLPPNLQSTVVDEARSYARAMKAALFFSSATHNINVNKIFKFIMADLFNLPWTVERNLTIGEPIIDFESRTVKSVL